MFFTSNIRRCLCKNNFTNTLYKRKKSDNINNTNNMNNMSSKIDTEKICSENCTNNLLQTKLNYALAFFSIGGIVQIYTYSKTNDFNKSTGIGWGFLLACAIIG